MQISSPRLPCRNISRYWKRPKLLRLVEKSGRTGWYLRVLEEGAVQAGRPVELVERPNPEWSVTRVSRVKPGTEEGRELGRVPQLSPAWSEWFSA